MTRRQRERLRSGLVALIVGAVAVLCLSSTLFAVIAAALTVAAVIADAVAQRPRSATRRGGGRRDRLQVDLRDREVSGDPDRRRRR